MVLNQIRNLNNRFRIPVSLVFPKLESFSLSALLITLDISPDIASGDFRV